MANNDYLDYINLDGVEYDIKDNISGYITGITETDVTEALGDISANNVFAGPTSGNADEASFRQLVVDDIPSIPVSKISNFPSTMPPSSHTHGDITNSGDITTTATIASGDRLVINDESASKITNSSITFGSSTTTFLANDGEWLTPANTDTKVAQNPTNDANEYPILIKHSANEKEETDEVNFVVSKKEDGVTINPSTSVITAAQLTIRGSVSNDSDAATKAYADGKQTKITASGILKGNGSGTVTAAVAGTDYQAPLPSQTGNSGKFLTTNGSALSWGTADSLPDQTGNSGKYLTTNGTTASWGTVDALPAQSGQSGKYLTTDGTDASWANISPNVPYLTCSNYAYTVAKTTTLVSGTFTSADLVSGAQVLVKFTYSNTATNPTININNTGAISIKRYGTVAAGTTISDSWKANSVVMLVYDGTNWIIQNSTYSEMEFDDLYSTNSVKKLISTELLRYSAHIWGLPETVAHQEDLSYPNSMYLRRDPSGFGSDIDSPYNESYWDTLPIYETHSEQSFELFSQDDMTTTFDSTSGEYSWQAQNYTNEFNDGTTKFVDYVMSNCGDTTFGPYTGTECFPPLNYNLSNYTDENNWFSESGNLVCIDGTVSAIATLDGEECEISCVYETEETSSYYLRIELTVERAYVSDGWDTSSLIDTITNIVFATYENNVPSLISTVQVNGNYPTTFVQKLDGKFLNEEVAPLNTYMKKGIDYVTAGKRDGTTLGSHATAEGYYTTASGSYGAHAEGDCTTASGNSAHSEGYYTIASGRYSHAEGYYTTAQRKSQHVFGEYNKLDTAGGTTTRGTYVEIVGNGSSSFNRNNARTLDWSGNETLAGKLTLGADPTANMEAATKQYVDGKVSALGTVLNYKGTKASAAQLPTTGNTTGDVWIVTIDNSEHVWNGNAWEEFGPNIDLSGYVPTSRTVNGKALSANISLTASDVGALSDTTVIPVIKTIENPQISAVNGVFTWTIPASSAGGDMNSNILITIYELSTGAVIYPNVVVNQSSGNVTITINDTASAGTLAAGTYKAVIIG